MLILHPEEVKEERSRITEYSRVARSSLGRENTARGLENKPHRADAHPKETPSEDGKTGVLGWDFSLVGWFCLFVFSDPCKDTPEKKLV